MRGWNRLFLLYENFSEEEPKIYDTFRPVVNVNVMDIVVDFDDSFGDGGRHTEVVDGDEETFEFGFVLLRQGEGKARNPQQHLLSLNYFALVLVVVAEGVPGLGQLVQVLQLLHIL